MDHADFGLADSLPQFARDILRCRRTHAPRSQRLGQRIECNGTQRAGDRKPKLPYVAQSRDAPTLIVGDDGNERETLPNGAFKIGNIEREGAVAR